MNFEDERYVRLYTRKTVTSKLLGWEGRTVLHHLLIEVDRAGVLDLEGEGPAEALAAMSELPVEVCRVGMARLIDRGVVTIRDSSLVLPRFLEAQEARQSDAQRQRESRAKRATLGKCSPAAARAMGSVGIDVTNRDHIESQDVTDCHTLSHGVTLGHSQLSSAQLSNPSLRSGSEDAAPRSAPPPPDVVELSKARAAARPEKIQRDWRPPPKTLEAQAARYGVSAEVLERTIPEFVDYWDRSGKVKSAKGWIQAWTNRLGQLAGRDMLVVQTGVRRHGFEAPPGFTEHEKHEAAWKREQAEKAQRLREQYR